jgi:2-keto-3-deoxy-L-rhamnonate aldolase RhmA
MARCRDAAAAKRWIAAGFDSVALGLDTAVYIRAYRSMVEEINS